MVISDKDARRGLVLPGYLSEQVIPEVADVLYFEQLLYWLPTGFTDVEYTAVANFPRFCADEGIELPGITWDLISSYREADAKALEAAKVLKPLKEGDVIKYVLPVYGRGRREVAAAAAIVSADSYLKSCVASAPFDIWLLARELVGHALFGVFVEDGYKGSVSVFREGTSSDESLTALLEAVVVNRLIAMVMVSPSAVIYDSRWLPVLEAVEHSSHIPHVQPQDSSRETDPVEYTTFRIFGEILRPVFGRCDELSKNSWVTSMRQARRDDILALRAQCRAVALSVLAASDALPSVREEILRRELQERIADPLRGLTSSAEWDARNISISVLLDSSVVGALLGILSGFDPRAMLTATAAAAVASIGRRMFESSNSPGHLTLLRDGLIATEGEYAQMRRDLLEITVGEVIR
jgi:hypothetical protein